MSLPRDRKHVYRSVSPNVAARLATVREQVEQGRMAATLNQEPDGSWTDAQLAGWLEREGRNG